MVNHLAAKVSCKLMPLFNIRDVTYVSSRFKRAGQCMYISHSLFCKVQDFSDTQQEWDSDWALVLTRKSTPVVCALFS